MEYKSIIDGKGLKHTYIARALDVTPQFLSMCLNGKKKFPRKRELMLKKVLGL